jgi:hypothetical protein
MLVTVDEDDRLKLTLEENELNLDWFGQFSRISSVRGIQLINQA